MFKFTIRELLLLTVVFGLAAAWWVDRGRQASAHLREVKKLKEVAQALPFKVQRYFVNGQVSREWWERRTIDGGTETLLDLGSISFYSNGVKATEYYSGDENLSRHYSPDGKSVSHSEAYEFYLRDRGDGTFADSLPEINGRPAPMAREFTQRPVSL
jgi:hypothetical protein